MIWGKIWRAHPTKSGHFAPAYLDGSNKLRASLEISLCQSHTTKFNIISKLFLEWSWISDGHHKNVIIVIVIIVIVVIIVVIVVVIVIVIADHRIDGVDGAGSKYALEDFTCFLFFIEEI